jgi:GNAT superfamily N-acetyltransferase
MRIRPAVRDDVPLILDLIRELAEYERAPDAVHATLEDLVRDGFGDRPAFHVLIADDDEGPAGFAFYFFTYSTWEGRSVLYLEDLFVRPAFRGRGIGLALMRMLASEAVTQKCARFQWQVLDWNQPAIDFYARLGADVQPEWQTVRLEGEALARASEVRISSPGRATEAR